MEIMLAEKWTALGRGYDEEWASFEMGLKIVQRIASSPF